jgi:hypothetical protein
MTVTFTGIFAIFREAFRSVALLLLPLAFVSLIIWATAGSSSGSTSDPIFTSLWFYLAAHQIPLEIEGSLADARLTLLPLGALALVFVAIRSGVIRSVAIFDVGKKRIVVLLFALFYSLLLIVISLLSSLRDEVVSVKPYLAIPIALLITLIFSVMASQLMPKRTRAPWEVASAWAAFALGGLILLATIVLLISLAIHYRAVIDLSTVIAPGIFGGIALIAIQILYLPNMVIATLGYISGSGAHIGSGSMIHPFIFELDQLPALPLLGALPRGTFPWAISGALIVIALGYVMHRKLRARFGDDLSSWIALGSFSLLALLIGSSASGQLITDILGEVGPSWWRFPAVLTGELALGMALSRTILWAETKLAARRQANPENKEEREGSV